MPAIMLPRHAALTALALFTACVGMRACAGNVGVAQAPSTPIALHPDNPHYFQWRGKPTILITSGEHYGAVMNLDFDYRKYLDTLAADGLNYTRVFSGAYVEPQGAFNIAQNTMAPAAGRLSCAVGPQRAAWLRGRREQVRSRGVESRLLQAADGLRQYASSKGIVVELTLFCPMYEEIQWTLSPMNVTNNINGIGAVQRNDVYTLDKDAKLLATQDALTRKIVTELNGFDNVFYEICNEPYFGGVTMPWQHHIADVIVEAERAVAREAPHRTEHRQQLGQDHRAACGGLDFQLPLRQPAGHGAHELRPEQSDGRRRDGVPPAPATRLIAARPGTSSSPAAGCSITSTTRL